MLISAAASHSVKFTAALSFDLNDRIQCNFYDAQRAGRANFSITRGT